MVGRIHDIPGMINRGFASVLFRGATFLRAMDGPGNTPLRDPVRRGHRSATAQHRLILKVASVIIWGTHTCLWSLLAYNRLDGS